MTSRTGTQAIRFMEVWQQQEANRPLHINHHKPAKADRNRERERDRNTKRKSHSKKWHITENGSSRWGRVNPLILFQYLLAWKGNFRTRILFSNSFAGHQTSTGHCDRAGRCSPWHSAGHPYQRCAGGVGHCSTRASYTRSNPTAVIPHAFKLEQKFLTTDQTLSDYHFVRVMSFTCSVVMIRASTSYRFDACSTVRRVLQVKLQGRPNLWPPRRWRWNTEGIELNCREFQAETPRWTQPL